MTVLRFARLRNRISPRINAREAREGRLHVGGYLCECDRTPEPNEVAAAESRYLRPNVSAPSKGLIKGVRRPPDGIYVYTACRSLTDYICSLPEEYVQRLTKYIYRPPAEYEQCLTDRLEAEYEHCLTEYIYRLPEEYVQRLTEYIYRLPE